MQKGLIVPNCLRNKLTVPDFKEGVEVALGVVAGVGCDEREDRLDENPDVAGERHS